MVAVLPALGIALLVAGGSSALEIRACALVEAKAAGWKEVPDTAVVDPTGLSFKRKFFLAGRSPMPVRAPEVKSALREATRGLKPAERRNTLKLLSALEDWSATALVEEPGPVSCPAAWKTSAQVLKARGGNAFELVRALTSMLRAAGVPARPSFNGLPMVCLYAVPRGKSGFWTVWDPLHPSASLRRLPVLWLPLRAEEVPLVAVKPAIPACTASAEGRRYPTKDEAKVVFEALKATGRFPEGGVEPLSADTAEWWEVWSIGAVFDPEPVGAFTATFPLPFVTDPVSRIGTREYGVWCSDPSRVRGRAVAHTRADQKLDGILMTLPVKVKKGG